jgi:hypothetical protein
MVDRRMAGMARPESGKISQQLIRLAFFMFDAVSFKRTWKRSSAGIIPFEPTEKMTR